MHDLIPPLHLALALFQLKHFSQFWTRPSMSSPVDVGHQAESREAMMVTAVQEDVAYEERLKGLLKFNLKKKKQSANRIAVLRYTYSSGMRKGIIYTSRDWQTLVKQA